MLNVKSGYISYRCINNFVKKVDERMKIEEKKKLNKEFSFFFSMGCSNKLQEAVFMSSMSFQFVLNNQLNLEMLELGFYELRRKFYDYIPAIIFLPIHTYWHTEKE